MASIFISAAHKSSGKTTISIGLCSALQQRGLNIQAFKKGPDYIDPMWLSMATKRPCYNLDFYTMGKLEIQSLFKQHSKTANISIIEGNKGLYDGLDLDGSNSNAAMATTLDIPVVLVLDARGMTRGIAPLVLGYQSFETSISIKGVILNNVGGNRHEAKLRAILEHYTDVKVIGSVHRHPELCIDERHLGLVPSNEAVKSLEKIALISTHINNSVDLESLLTLSETPVESPDISVPELKRNDQPPVRIGVAQDSAFGFYYPDDLQSFNEQGAELVYINTLSDTQLPAIDGLFIGGGFPETHLPQLSANQALMKCIKSAIENGLPTYAECGGLMYLARSIEYQKHKVNMVGVIPGDIKLHKKPQGRGYVTLAETGNHLWAQTDSNINENNQTALLPAHEFHYSSLDNAEKLSRFAYTVKRGFGIDGTHDGLILYNLVANYSHFRNVGTNHWITRFLTFVRKIKAQSLN